MPLTAQENIFPTLSGTRLLDSLVAQYKPASGFNYANARDTLYGRILNPKDSLTCLYTGYTIYLNPAKDPTQDAFDKGINTEHIYPQSKGASEEMARSDMHHLFPTRVDVNADRGDLPFGEVPDEQTISWYFQDEKQSAVPGSSRLDAYSELGAGHFEARESVKGDVARAMFYFYTMYREEADLADRDYFDLQRNALCDWHLLDPVDLEEWNKNQRIAAYQDDKPNPYILDCTLAFRAFCSERPLPTCSFTDVQQPLAKVPIVGISVFPNPFASKLTIRYMLQQSTRIQIRLTDVWGRVIHSFTPGFQAVGEYRTSWDTGSLPSGIYLLECREATGQQHWQLQQKVIHY